MVCVFRETIEKPRWSTEDLFPVPVSCVFCHLLDIWESIGTHYFFLTHPICSSLGNTVLQSNHAVLLSIHYLLQLIHAQGVMWEARADPSCHWSKATSPPRPETCCVSSFFWMWAFRVLPAFYLLFKWHDQLQVDEGADCKAGFHNRVHLNSVHYFTAGPIIAYCFWFLVLVQCFYAFFNSSIYTSPSVIVTKWLT